MKTYTNYQQIKDEFKTDSDPNKPYNVFTDYVMDRISLEQRKSIREDWNKLENSVLWEDYLLQRVNVKEIKSYLPLFSGFQYTMFDSEQAELTVLEEENLNDDEVGFDYAEYRDRVGVACVNSVWNFLKLDGFEIDIEFEKIYSPREYNFGNDVIYCTYKVSDEDFNSLIEYCKTNSKPFLKYLLDKYSSRPGFSSFFSVSPKKWFNEYLKKDSDKFERAFAGILEFYLLNDGYSVDDMLDDVADETSYIDYEILTNH